MIRFVSLPPRAAALAALFALTLATGCGSGGSSGEGCSSGWVTYGNTPYCYCAATDRLIDCADAGKIASMVAREGAAWVGNANGPYVLDADQEGIWFGAEAPHVMHVGRAAVLSAHADAAGVVFDAGRPIATVRSVLGREGDPVAVLVTPEGTWADVTLDGDIMRIVPTDIPAVGSDGVSALASPPLSMASSDGPLDAAVLRDGRQPVRTPDAAGDA